MPTLSISGSVGRDGQNDRYDVQVVQELLNVYLSRVGAPQLAVDGFAGPETAAAIERFQRDVVRLHNIDGLVEPDGQTFHALVVGYVDDAADGDDLPKIAWGKQVSPKFKQKILAIAKGLGTKADYLMSAIAFESAETFSPDVRNKYSGAVGLIQFMPNTATRLGTTTDALAKMTAEDQLDYVEKYFQPFQQRVGALEDLYMAILWPAAMGKPLEYVLFQTPSQAYVQNKGLDGDHDGVVTKREAAAPVAAKLSRGLEFVG